MNLDRIREKARQCEEARDAGEGTVGAYGWAAAAIASAADVPALIQEIEWLRRRNVELIQQRNALHLDLLEARAGTGQVN